MAGTGSEPKQPKKISGLTQEINALSERFDIAARPAEAVNERIEVLSEEMRMRKGRWYGRLFQNYISDDPDGLATFIAFNAMFAFMPVILTLAIILALVLRLFTTADEVASNELTLELPMAISEPVRQVMVQSSEGILGIGIVTLAVLFWGGTRFYNSLDLAFARIYRTQRRPWVTRKLAGMIMVPLLSFAIVLSALIVPAVVSLLLLPLAALADFGPSLSFYVGAVLIFYTFGFLMMILAYKMIPVHSPTFRAALPGAAVAALLFMLLALSFPIYLRYFDSYSIYGAVFGLILAMMLWFYLAAQTIVIGAEINAFFEGRRSDASAPDASGPGDFEARFRA